MQTPFPLAFSTLGCPDWSFGRAAAEAAAHGYSALEVRVLDGAIIPPDLDPARRRQIHQTLNEHDLTIVALGASTRFASADAATRRANQDQLRQYLRLANDMGVPMVRTFGGDVDEGHTLDETIQWVTDSLAAVLPEAEAQGVTVLLETHDAFCRGDTVARVLDAIDHPRLKAVWDTHHPYRMGESVEETWQAIGAHVAHVHIKDARRVRSDGSDGSWQLVLLGEGEVPNRQIIQLLHREGYRGYLSAEWEKKWHPEIEEPEIALPQHAQVLRSWLAELK